MDCPGDKISPADTPLSEKGAPERVTLDTVTSEFPAFVKVTLSVPLFPGATLPKLKLGALTESSVVGAVAVPLKETMLGELEISLAMAICCARAPAVVGVKTTSNVACFPAPITIGKVAPLILMPAALTLALVTVRLDPPRFDMVTD